jgi:hypothetical protein
VPVWADAAAVHPSVSQANAQAAVACVLNGVIFVSMLPPDAAGRHAKLEFGDQEKLMTTLTWMNWP